MHCDTNIPNYDFTDPTSLVTDDVYACMAQCSVARPECYGVAFNVPDGFCYLKKEGIGNSTLLTGDIATHSALVIPTSQLSSTDTSCPFTSSSLQSTDNGMQFDIECGQDILGGDYCPTGNSSCPFHASSLGECMALCSQSHPLCSGVSFNPDMIVGYANCYPKNNLASQAFTTHTGFVIHSAVAKITNGTSNCTDQARVSASGKSYTTNCNQNQAGNDLTVYHDTSLDRCLDTCATWTSGSCIGVVFDAHMDLGWQNCYLKNGTSTPQYNTSATFALLSNSTSSASSSSSSSKAWIAGPVVGGIVVLALLAGFFIWMKRRKARQYAAPFNSNLRAQNDRKVAELGGGRAKYVPYGPPAGVGDTAGRGGIYGPEGVN